MKQETSLHMLNNEVGERNIVILIHIQTQERERAGFLYHMSRLNTEKLYSQSCVVKGHIFF